jgi:histidinol-phosphate/aromatic aminotransferase/cobyric acid decarboxylase-like protein
VLDKQEYYSNIISLIYQNKQIIVDFLSEKKVQYIDTDANFLCVEVGDVSNFLGEAEKAGLLFRDISARETMAGYIRMTIGNEKSTEKVLNFLNTMF